MASYLRKVKNKNGIGCANQVYMKYISSGAGKMNKLFTKVSCLFALLLFLGCGITAYCIARDSKSNHDLPDGVYLKLNREFYESLNDTNKNTYTNDKSSEYLREISISSRCVVESNLQIIRQQEEIIRLLKTIADKK